MCKNGEWPCSKHKPSCLHIFIMFLAGAFEVDHEIITILPFEKIMKIDHNCCCYNGCRYKKKNVAFDIHGNYLFNNEKYLQMFLIAKCGTFSVLFFQVALGFQLD